MSELRWILIVLGALLLLGIYLWGRRSARVAAVGEEPALSSREPHGAFVFREAPSDLRDVPADESPMPAAAEEGANSAPGSHLGSHLDNHLGDHWRSAPPAAGPELPVANEVTDSWQASAALGKDKEVRRTRVEPTLGEDIGVENRHAAQPLPVLDAVYEDAHQAAVPTLSLSDTHPPRRIERRKIISLRIAAGPQRFAGEQLLEAVQTEGLQHGKYGVFHRLDDLGASVFSVASMVEPGAFDLLRMRGASFPGITLFAQFPGPCGSLLAFNELLSSAKRLQEKLGGALQDDRGVPLTVHRIERLRQEIREFEQGELRDGSGRVDTAPATP